MRAPAAQARAIQRGAKTQHRVPVDPRITARPLRPARRHGGNPFLPVVDDILTIHGGHHEHDGARLQWVPTDTAHCKILVADRGPLGTLTSEDAKAEGWPTVQEFELAFVEWHERAWLDRQVSYLVEQGISDHEAAETRDAWAKVRYDSVWAIREAWHLTIQPFDDMPYLLPGLVEEPEGVPVERLRQRWTTKAAARYEDARGEEERVRDAKQLGRRLRSAKLRTPDAPQVAVIEQQLAELEAQDAQAA